MTTAFVYEKSVGIIKLNEKKLSHLLTIFEDLIKMLTYYRLTFGQPSQQELIKTLEKPFSKWINMGRS